ncbi:MAG: molybdopterin-guanine dinucleotide biosynthesis protein MobA, partial [Lachnospiraceae bacterium]|nr:molybdopterin-guanine dinucleotide biosynthesis protein MobA [Lachnospiraceae bacterium]
MSLFHFHVTQVKRSAGQSAVACAAYRAGEKLYSEYYGEASD